MKKMIMVIAALFSFGLAAEDADAARRLGGGSSVGTQRSITPPAAKPQAPAATPAAPTPQPQPSGMSRWLGPLAGLAIGAGLASLFFNNGMAGAFGGILMVMLLAAAAIFIYRLLRGRPQSAPLQFAGAGAAGARSDISTGFGGGAATALAKRYPPDFDAEQFVRHAKLNFARLQAANDQRDASTMRDYMTPELYAEIVADLKSRDAKQQQTEVVTLNAEVLEVVTENDHYIASVRFDGVLRDRADGADEPFSEVWHLEKPLDGRTGWLLCGIQQD